MLFFYANLEDAVTELECKGMRGDIFPPFFTNEMHVQLAPDLGYHTSTTTLQLSK